MDFNPHLIARVEFVSAVENALKLDHNPQFKPWQKPSPNNVAGKGTIEAPGQARNIVWQNRPAAPSDYENALGDALERAYDAGATSAEEVVAALNAAAFRMPDGQAWSVERFEAELARLGNW